jgi:hypothetical protein
MPAISLDFSIYTIRAGEKSAKPDYIASRAARTAQSNDILLP